NMQCVGARDSASDGEVVALRSDSGEKYGEKPGGGADHHGSEIDARSEKGWEAQATAQGQAHHGHARDNGKRNEEGDGMGFVVVERGRACEDGCRDPDGGKCNGSHPDAASEVQCSPLEVAFGLQREVEGSV